MANSGPLLVRGEVAFIHGASYTNTSSISGTSDATDDYGDTVHWSGRTWWRTEGRTRADTGLASGVVTCSIAEIPDENGWRVSQQGWADGTATVLPRGTRLYSPREDRAGDRAT